MLSKQTTTLLVIDFDKRRAKRYVGKLKTHTFAWGQDEKPGSQEFESARAMPEVVPNGDAA